MKIYKDYLNELGSFEMDINVYKNQKHFIEFHNYIMNIIKEIFYENEKLQISCLKAICNFCRPDNTYVIHKFKQYYAISRTKDYYEPIEIDDVIQVFNEEQIFPLQKIEIVVDFKY